MCTNVRFHATVILGDGVRRMHKAEASLDDVLASDAEAFATGSNSGANNGGGMSGEGVIVCSVPEAGGMLGSMMGSMTLSPRQRQERQEQEKLMAAADIGQDDLTSEERSNSSGVRSTKKACNSSTMTILAPIALLGRECLCILFAFIA